MYNLLHVFVYITYGICVGIARSFLHINFGRAVYILPLIIVRHCAPNFHTIRVCSTVHSLGAAYKTLPPQFKNYDNHMYRK